MLNVEYHHNEVFDAVKENVLWLVQWPYEEFISIVPTVKAPTGNEFTITMKKNTKKTDTMRFSTDHRADLLTEALRFRHLFAERIQSTAKV